MWPARAPCSHLPSQQTGNSSSSSTSLRLLQQRLLQHSVMHTTAASVGQQGTHRRAHAHTHKYVRTYTHTHAHTHTNTNARKYSQARTLTYTCTRTNTQTHAQAHTHTHAHMHMHAHVARVMGFAYFSASLATLPHCPVGFTACTCVHVCVRACVCVCVWRAACDVQVNLCTSANLSPLSLCASYALQMCACMCV